MSYPLLLRGEESVAISASNEGHPVVLTAITTKHVPHDSVPAGPPIPVSRPVTATNNSAPVTDPTLTANNTDLNTHTMQRTRARDRRDHPYTTASASTQSLGSPHTSLATDDHSALHSESTESISNSHASFAAPRLQVRQSGSSSIHDSSRKPTIVGI
jgi:hypothetical protein